MSVPPNSAARSRMPTSPWPPRDGERGRGALASPLSTTLSSSAVGAVAER
jgi:hypothetical protein